MRLFRFAAPAHMRQAVLHLLGLVVVIAGVALPIAPALAADGPVRVAVSDPYWIGVYFNNVDLAGTPKLTRVESNIDFGWGNGSPDPVIQNDHFSARWTRYLYLEEGIYRFSATTDDGMRIWVDDQQILNEWREQSERTFVWTALWQQATIWCASSSLKEPGRRRHACASTA